MLVHANVKRVCLNLIFCSIPLRSADVLDVCKLLPRFPDSICLPLLRTLAGAAAFQKRYIRTCMQCMCEYIFSNRFALATRKCAYWVPQLIPRRVSFQGLAKFLHSFLAELCKFSCRTHKDFARILQRILVAFLHDLAECLARILHSTSYKILLLASPCKTSHQNLARWWALKSCVKSCKAHREILQDLVQEPCKTFVRFLIIVLHDCNKV